MIYLSSLENIVPKMIPNSWTKFLICGHSKSEFNFDSFRLTLRFSINVFKKLLIKLDSHLSIPKINQVNDAIKSLFIHI